MYTRKLEYAHFHQLFDYKITFVNSQHENTNSNGDFVLKDSKDFWYTKINLTNKIWYDKDLRLKIPYTQDTNF